MSFAAELELGGCQVLIGIGDARVIGTVRRLLETGALVTVVAESHDATLIDLIDRGLITASGRDDLETVLLQVSLVITAADDAALLDLAARHRVPTVRVPSAGDDPRDSANRQGRVILVGGGPGSTGLLTVAGLEAIKTADVIICDRLAPLAALDHARSEAKIIDVGKIPRGAFTPQEQINDLLVQHAKAGRQVVRFKGGDNFVFGRGGEEWQACTAAGVPVEVIPGVSSAVAVPGLAGIPLTHRQLTQGFTVVSGHLPPGDPGSTLDWAALAKINTTLVIMMGVATLPKITEALIRYGLAAETPAATIADGGLASQRVIRGPLGTIGDLASEAGIRPPAITVIGAVAGFDPTS